MFRIIGIMSGPSDIVTDSSSPFVNLTGSSLTARLIRSAIWTALLSVQFGRSTANSSPPIRAAGSVFRMLCFRREASSFST